MDELDHIFHPAFFIASSRGAKPAVKQVSTAKGHKPLVLFPILAFQHLLHRAFQVVIRRAVGNPAPKFKGMAVTLEEGFLAGVFKGFTIKTAGIVQHQQQDLNQTQFSGNDDP